MARHTRRPAASISIYIKRENGGRGWGWRGKSLFYCSSLGTLTPSGCCRYNNYYFERARTSLVVNIVIRASSLWRSHVSVLFVRTVFGSKRTKNMRKRERKNWNHDNDDGKLFFSLLIHLARTGDALRFLFFLLWYEHGLHNPQGITQINSDFPLSSTNNGDNVVHNYAYIYLVVLEGWIQGYSSLAANNIHRAVQRSRWSQS